MKNKKIKSGSSTIKLVAIGASLAGLAATTYFFLGSKGKKHQKQTQAWAIKMKQDIVEKLKIARDVSEPAYKEIIDSIATEYEKGKKASHGEIVALAKDLKKHWKTISNSAKVVKNDMVKSAKRVAKVTKL